MMNNEIENLNIFVENVSRRGSTQRLQHGGGVCEEEGHAVCNSH